MLLFIEKNPIFVNDACNWQIVDFNVVICSIEINNDKQWWLNSTNYDNVCQQLICFMLNSPITTKNENNRIQCKYSNLWLGTITNIPINGSQFSRVYKIQTNLGTFSRLKMATCYQESYASYSWWFGESSFMVILCLSSDSSILHYIV